MVMKVKIISDIERFSSSRESRSACWRAAGFHLQTARLEASSEVNDWLSRFESTMVTEIETSLGQCNCTSAVKHWWLVLKRQPVLVKRAAKQVAPESCIRLDLRMPTWNIKNVRETLPRTNCLRAYRCNHQHCIVLVGELSKSLKMRRLPKSAGRNSAGRDKTR